MNILIVGSGGREHAVAKSFARSSKVKRIIVCPGNAGIAKQYECVSLSDHLSILQFCHAEDVHMVFIGPEQAIAEGLSDYLAKSGIAVVAPSKQAAQLECSKMFAKDLMIRAGIPTAKYIKAFSKEEALKAVSHFSYPVVIKADGLAAGKGVCVAQDSCEAATAIDMLFAHNDGYESSNASGAVIEEFLSGWEVSLFAFCDGEGYQTSLFAQDHKQIFDHDLGPNTGGMGAVCPVPKAEKYRSEIEATIISPILQAMRENGTPYKGILYCGLMITKDGPKVIEFNCRLGDPEAEVLLPLIETDFVDICSAMISGNILELDLRFSTNTAVGVVMASKGYPGKYEKGYPISIRRTNTEGIYFSGVAENESGLVSAGGRVMCIVGVGNDLTSARVNAYANISDIHFDNAYYRTDIGLRSNDL